MNRRFWLILIPTLLISLLVVAYQELAECESSKEQNPDDPVQNAIKFAEQALAINPKSANVFTYAANALLVQARFELDHSLNPSKSLAAAREYVGKALEINPDYFDALLSYATEAVLQVRLLKEGHKNSAAAIEEPVKQ